MNEELARVNGMLNNEKFVSKAPEAKIDEEKAKLAEIHADDGAGKRAAFSACEIGGMSIPPENFSLQHDGYFCMM